MEIRKLTESDYEQVLELYVALDDFHAKARPDCCVLLGAFEGERLIGVVRATLWEDSVMVKGLRNVCLDNIYVLPAYRRRGIAARLFAMVEDWARERGAVRLDLYTWDFNKGAIAMYRAMGMTPQQYVFEKKL